MLSISKNKSKNSQAQVRIIKKPKPAPAPQPTRQFVPVPVPQAPPMPPPTAPGGIQKNLNETTFRQYLDGFVGILPKDLPATLGNRLRYAIDTVDSTGRTVSTQYRLGGWVKSVAPDLSSVILFNPYARKSWTLKIPQPANKRLRLYFARRGTSDETATIRALVTKIQNGQVRVSRA
jgi:hypothetical protein